MTTDLVPVGAGVSRAPVMQSYGDAFNFAKHVANTELVPVTLRGSTEKVFAVIAWGLEAGIGPMQALRGVQIIEGQAGPKPELARALVMSRGHTFGIVEWNDRVCSVRGRRADSGEELTVTYTLDDAVQAGLVQLRDGKPFARSRQGNPLPWEKHTKRMLLARATGDLTAALFPDVVAGLSYMADELSEIAGKDYDMPDAEVPSGEDIAPGDVGDGPLVVASPAGDDAPGSDVPASDPGATIVDAEVVEDAEVGDPPAAPPPGVDPETGEMRSVHDQLIAEMARLKGPAKVQFIKWLNEQRFPSLPAHMDDEQATAALAHLTGEVA